MLLRFPFFLVIVFSTLATLSTQTTYAQTATIKGTVKNEVGLIVNNSTLFIKETEKGIATDSKGNFSLEVPINKKITLVISNAMYETYEKNFNLKSGQIVTLNVELKERTLTTFTFKETYIDPGTGTTEYIKIKDPENITTPIPNLENMLQSIAVGVRQTSELSAGYNVRGGNFDENLIYVNGIEIYRPFLARSGQQEGLSFINPNMVDNIVFSAGGFDAKYGDKLSSVLDVRYKDPQKFKASAIASFTGASVYVQDTINIRSNFLIGARYHSNAYLLGALDTKGDYKPVFIDVQGMYNKYLTDETRLSVYASYANNKYRVIPETKETNFGSINEALRFTVFYEGQEITQFQTYFGAISIQNKPRKDKLTLNYVTSIFRTQETEKFDLLGEYKIDELERNLGNDGFGDVAYNRGVGAFREHARNEVDALVGNIYHKGKLKHNERSQLEWGVKFQHEDIIDKISEWNMLDSARYSIPSHLDSAGYTDPNAQPYQNLELVYSLKAKNHVISNRATAFIQERRGWEKKAIFQFQDTLYINDSTVRYIDTTLESEKYINATIGVRAHYWDFNKQTVFSPRASINFKPAWFFNHNNEIWRRNITFKLATGFYYQPPFYREIRNLQGQVNPDIRAQKSIHFVAGMNYTYYMWDRPFKLVSEVYYKHLTDIIPYEIDNVRTRYLGVNNAKGYATGIDFKINGEFIKDVESFISLSFLQTKEDILDDFYYEKYNTDGELIIPGYTPNSVVSDSVRVEPGYLPRPTDQLFNFAMMFKDQMPEEWNTEKIRWSTFKVNLNLVFGSRLPYGPPGGDRYRDTLRSSLYRRVDIGFSKDIIHAHTDRTKFGKKSILNHIDRMWISFEVFNLLDIINTTNYNWITDVSGRKYSIPNTLTSRRLNLKFVVVF